MANTNELLRQIGLTDTEVSIYLSGLSRKNVGVSELIKETGINRTTIYHALETLSQKGLVAKKGTGSRLNFIMVQPDNLQRLLDSKIKILQSQKESLKEVIPFLVGMQGKSGARINVSHFEGIEGIKTVIEEAIYCRERKWDIIAPAENFFSEFDKEYAKYFLEARRRKGIVSRSLWEKTENRKPLSEIEKKERNPRLLPSVMYGKFRSVIIIFDDKVAFITSLKELSAILVQSREIRDTLDAIFEGLWTGSKEYR